MSKKPICAQLAVLLLVASPAFAQDAANWQVEGSATLGGIDNSTSDTKDASKLKEYRDLRNGALSNIFVRGRSGPHVVRRLRRELRSRRPVPDAARRHL